MNSLWIDRKNRQKLQIAKNDGGHFLSSRMVCLVFLLEVFFVYLFESKWLYEYKMRWNNIYICVTQSWKLNNLGIFSTNYIITVKKHFKRPNKIYIYLESARRDLQNDEIYQMSRFAKFLRIWKNRSYKKFFFNFQRIFCLLKNLTQIFTPFCRSRRADSKYIYLLGLIKYFFTIII